MSNNQPTMPVPDHVDPAVLAPGTVVIAMLDETRTPLTVIRVEPMLYCAKPDGGEVTLFAHEVYPADTYGEVKP